MNAADLKARLAGAWERLGRAETELQRTLQQVEHAERADKSMVSAALSTALAELKAARQELHALEQVIAADD